tara:strand:- start:1250 stop:1636 length:387 start_codon:yes stop_codon:yes gene_type:complete
MAPNRNTKLLSTYDAGKIYYFFCKETREIYIGSTRQTLRKRISDHQTDLKGFMGELNTQRRYRSSFDVMINGKYETGLLEAYPCNSKEELEKRESQWIMDCYKKDFVVVNKLVPRLTLPATDLPELTF